MCSYHVWVIHRWHIRCNVHLWIIHKWHTLAYPLGCKLKWNGCLCEVPAKWDINVRYTGMRHEYEHVTINLHLDWWRFPWLIWPDLWSLPIWVLSFEIKGQNVQFDVSLPAKEDRGHNKQTINRNMKHCDEFTSQLWMSLSANLDKCGKPMSTPFRTGSKTELHICHIFRFFINILKRKQKDRCLFILMLPFYVIMGQQRRAFPLLALTCRSCGSIHRYVPPWSGICSIAATS